MTSTLKRCIAITASLAAISFVLTACVSTGSGPSGPADSGGDAAIDASLNQIALDYVGGVAGSADDSLEPVKIGFINVEGGAASFPDVTTAARAATDYVNDYLGGVDGHPLELELCAIVQGDEDGLKCAQQFANDPSIASIQLGLAVFGTGPIFPTVGDRKPIIGFGPIAPHELTAENAIFWMGGGFSTSPAMLLYARDALDAKTVALVYDGSNTGASATAQTVSALATEVGIEVNAVPANNTSEWSTALVSAGASSAGAVILVGDTTTCVPAALAIEQLALTTPIVTTTQCLDTSVAEALGDYPEWSFGGPLVPPVDSSDDAKVLIAAMDHYAPGVSLSGIVPMTFGLVLSQVRAMNTVGVDGSTPDSKALAIELREFTGPAFLGPKELECGAYAAVGAPSVCSSVDNISTYKDGEWSVWGDGVKTGDIAFSH